jgi:hypothetical protein
MANFDLILATLAHGEPVSAADLKYLAECVAKCPNLAEGSEHGLSGTVELTSGTVELSGTAEILLTGSTKWPQLSSRTFERAVRAPWIPEAFGVSSNWSYSYNADGIWYCLTTDELHIACEEAMDTGGTLNSIYLRLKHGAHASNWPPQYYTHVSVYKKSLDTGVLTLITECDDDASQSSYEDVHEVADLTTGLSATFAPGDRLFIRVATEHGTNAVTGTRVIGASVGMTLTELKPG